MKKLHLFVGYDSKEPAAYHTFVQSILTKSSGQVSVTPLVQRTLRAQGLYTRPRGDKEATEFSMTRFLVPYLANYQGLAIFADCDMLARVDLFEVLEAVWADPGKAVWVCKHDYTPCAETKMEGQTQTAYPRKNWSSFIVFNTPRCHVLSPEYVNSATGLNLHRFLWLKDEDIGTLPLEWNWLVGEYESNPNAKILHYTEGGPWLPSTAECDHSSDWLAEWYLMELPVRLAQGALHG